MRRVILLVSAVFILFTFSVTPIFAASNFFFVLPRTQFSEEKCVEEIKKFEQAWYSSGKSFNEVAGTGLTDLLGCGIKTGNIHLAYIPFYIKGIIEFLLAIAGLLAVIFIIYGGYQVLIGGIIEDKEAGKKTITYAIAGLIVCFLSWSIVNILQMLLTS